MTRIVLLVGVGSKQSSLNSGIYMRKFGIIKLDKEKNQYISEKLGLQNIVKEIKQYQQKWLQHVQIKKELC
jgi:hypothetical protein